MSTGRLIPVRFLTLTAHLVITIVIFWSKVSAAQTTVPNSSPKHVKHAIFVFYLCKTGKIPNLFCVISFRKQISWPVFLSPILKMNMTLNIHS